MARGTCNIETLSRELTDISGQEWFDLGIQLGVTDASLRNIEANHKGDVQRCKTEMLRVWLQSDPTNSWKELATALERMGKKVLAQSLLEKYNIMKGNCQNVNVKDDDLLDPSNPDSRRHVHDRCQTDKLDKEAQMNYASFAIKVAELLTKRKICLDKLILAWAYLDEETEVPQAVREAKDITSFVQALRQHQTWFNYGGLMFLATRFGGKEGKKLVKFYEGQLRHNVNERIKTQEVPMEASILTMKLNLRKYDDQDLIDFRNTLARVLKRGPHEFVLKSVREGCVELDYIIPSDLCDSIRSLEVTIELGHGVIKIFIDGEKVWPKTEASGSETKVVPDSKQLTSERELNIAGTAWKSHGITRSGSRRHPLVTRGVRPPLWLEKGTSPQSRHWLHLLLVVLVRVVVAMLSAVLLAVGIVILLWAGLKSYTASHIMIGVFCFVLGSICCLYFWKRKFPCC